MSTAASDLFDRTVDPPDDVVRGLELLRTSPPLWPIGAGRWLIAYERVEAFALAL